MNAFTDRIELAVKRPFRWKVYFIVLAGTVAGLVAVIPYARELGLTVSRARPSPLPPGLLLALRLVQDTVVYGVVAGIGLLLACRIGLGLPFIEGWLEKRPVRGRFLRILLFSVLTGVVGSLAIAGLDLWVFGPALKSMLQTRHAALAAGAGPAAWKGLLASFEGGVTEEVLMRLFVFTLLAWIGSLISGGADGRPSTGVLWAANVLAAVLFGLGHLPATAAMGLPLNALVITRAVVLNGLLGVAFGWLYWTRGLESAVIAHFSADVVLHFALVAL
jgi:hypothetical protein